MEMGLGAGVWEETEAAWDSWGANRAWARCRISKRAGLCCRLGAGPAWEGCSGGASAGDAA